MNIRTRWSHASAASKIGVVVVVTVLVALVAGVYYDQQRTGNKSPAAQTVQSPKPSAGEEPMPPLLAVIGDSYTGGSDMGGRGDDNWLPIVAERLDYLPCGFPVGGSGWTTGRSGFSFVARVDWAVELDPDVIVFFNGVNDLKTTPAQVGADASKGLADLRAKSPDVPVVVIGPVLVQDSSRSKTLEMSREVRAAALKHKAYWVDPVEEGWFAGDDRRLIGVDRFHPTNDGMVYLADKIQAELEDLGLADLPERKRDYWLCTVPTVPDQAVDTAPGP